MQEAIAYLLQVADQEKFAVVGLCAREVPDISLLAMQNGTGDYVKFMRAAADLVENRTTVVHVPVARVS